MRIGLIGAGRIGAFHAGTLQAHPGVGELLVADADPARAREVAARTGARALPVDAVFAARPDALVIASATAAHAPLLARAARAGIPAFCEKPIAIDLAGTVAALDAVAAAGGVLQVGFQRRFDPGYAAARQAVAEGRLGRLHTVRTVSSDAAPPPADYVPLSGGLYRDCLIHDFDILRWVTGREITEVYAVGANVGADFFRTAGDADTAAVLLTLEGGLLATATATRYHAAGYDVRMELAGTEDQIAVGVTGRTPMSSAEPAAARGRAGSYVPGGAGGPGAAGAAGAGWPAGFPGAGGPAADAGWGSGAAGTGWPADAAEPGWATGPGEHGAGRGADAGGRGTGAGPGERGGDAGATGRGRDSGAGWPADAAETAWATGPGEHGAGRGTGAGPGERGGDAGATGRGRDSGAGWPADAAETAWATGPGEHGAGRGADAGGRGTGARSGERGGDAGGRGSGVGPAGRGSGVGFGDRGGEALQARGAWEGFLDRFGAAYRAEIDAFLRVARGVAANPCEGREALRALLVAEACEVSRRERRPVRVAEVAAAARACEGGRRGRTEGEGAKGAVA